MQDDSWLTIGEVSRRLNIDGARLRDWCKKGLVEHEMRSNTRYIPETEIEKIVMIRDFFQAAKEAGTRKTFDDVREMLIKENLYYNQQQDLQSTEEIKRYEKFINEAIKNTRLEESLLFLAERLRDLPTQAEVKSLLEKFEEQKLLEDSSTKEELKRVGEQLEKSEAQNREMAETMKKMVSKMDSIQSELNTLTETKEEKENEESNSKVARKGLFGRFFK